MTKALTVLALFAIACDGGSKESGDTGDTTDTTPPGAHIDSCTWDIGLCYEFTDFAGTADWCDTIDGGYYTSFTTNATYADAPCSGGVYVCDVPAITSAGGEPASVYYDASINDPAGACASAGGTGHEL